MECPECGEPRPCRRIVRAEGVRCRFHGGRSPRGIAAGSYKHGRYSKDLPTRLAARAEEAIQNPALLEFREDIALLDARLGELLKRVDSGESGQLWRNLRGAWRRFEKAWKSTDVEQIATAIEELGAVIRAGSSDYAAWGDIRSVLEQRRRLVESEHKRLIAAETMITADRALLVFGAIGQIIRSHVHDRSVLESITRDVGDLLDIPDARGDNGKNGS